MPQDSIQLVSTADGSLTLFDPSRALLYRSKHGAATEARELFVEGTGLHTRPGDWVVLEFGFGGGMSFAQTVLARERAEAPGHLDFHSVERAPVSPSLVSHLPSPAANLAAQALEILQDEPEAHVTHGRTTLHLYKSAWTDFDQPTIQAHALYHDPFGPEEEPANWTLDAMRVSVAHMAPDGILATYTMAAHVRRAMAAAGLWVARAPGPGFKREITLSSPSAHALNPEDIISKYTPDKAQ